MGGDIEKSGKTILLVDDQSEVLDSVSEILRFFGHQVYRSKGGKEAVEVYRDNHQNIDLVILDMIMPGVSGREAFSKLFEINNNIKVLFSTGSGDVSEIKDVLNHHSVSMIRKPFDMYELSDKINEMLRIT
jgi:DNA-binding response OmpR family regulator